MASQKNLIKPLFLLQPLHHSLRNRTSKFTLLGKQERKTKLMQLRGKNSSKISWFLGQSHIIHRLYYIYLYLQIHVYTHIHIQIDRYIYRYISMSRQIDREIQTDIEMANMRPYQLALTHFSFWLTSEFPNRLFHETKINK